MSLQAYHEKFMAIVDVLDQVGMTMADEALVRKIARDNYHPAVTQSDYDEAKELTFTMGFIENANHDYDGYRQRLAENFLDRNDTYPTTVADAYRIMERSPRSNNNNRRTDDNNGMAFAQDGNEQTDHSHIRCYGCQQYGHYASSCPRRNENNSNQDTNTEPPNQQGTQLVLQGVEQANGSTSYTFTQEDGSRIPRTWILLDSQSTVDVFHNASLLKNIRTITSVMEIRCNAGVRRTSQVGDLPGYGRVWYDPGSIANILSLSSVARKFDVVFDSRGENSFIVIKPTGDVVRFMSSAEGLYYVDTEDQ